MQNRISFSIVLGLLLTASALFAQSPDTKLINAGIGFSGWGIPVFANAEFPLKFDNQSVVVGGSFRTKRERFNYFNDKYAWRHTIIGLDAGWNYYLDELLELPGEFDVYGGLRLHYFIWNSSLVDPIDGFTDSYSGNSGGLDFSVVLGGRYHFQPNMSAFMQLGGSRYMSGLRAGVSFQF